MLADKGRFISSGKLRRLLYFAAQETDGRPAKTSPD